MLSGQVIRALREARGMTQSELADGLSRAAGFGSRILVAQGEKRGTPAGLTAHQIAALEKVLGVAEGEIDRMLHTADRGEVGAIVEQIARLDDAEYEVHRKASEAAKARRARVVEIRGRKVELRERLAAMLGGA